MIDEGHDHHHGPPQVGRLFWVCLVLTVPTLVFSSGLQDVLGLNGPRFPGSDYVPAAFGLAVFALGGRLFLSGAWAELRSRRPGNMTLISLALLTAFGYALAVTVGFDGMDFWWELATLVTILLLGHGIRTRAVSGELDARGDLSVVTSAAQQRADRAAAMLFYVALGVAALTLVAWLLLSPDDPAFVFERVVTVLVIAAPHALGLAIPLVAAISIALAADRGILVRDRAALEDARTIDVVVFDMSGTLTEGHPTLTRVVAATPGDEDEVLGLAAAVEARSEHQIGRALVGAARERKVKTGRPSGFTALAGRGATATVARRELTVASPRLTIERGIRLEPHLVFATREAYDDGATVVYLVEGSRAIAMFALADPVRPESAEAVTALHRRSIRVAMLTGDSHAAAGRVAGELGIEEVFSEVLPAERADVVSGLQADGAHPVAMVGDGVDDASALARADLGITIGSGADVAVESAGVVLVSSDPRGVVDTVALSRAAHRKILQNLAWVAGYNAVAIPLAAGVLAGVGILLPPALGALLMSASTLVVALNARRLRRLRFRR